eukprot:Gb_11790 [translate_table: standard]
MFDLGRKRWCPSPGVLNARPTMQQFICLPLRQLQKQATPCKDDCYMKLANHQEFQEAVTKGSLVEERIKGKKLVILALSLALELAGVRGVELLFSSSLSFFLSSSRERSRRVVDF